jgi:hypothetical protein
MFTKSDFIYHHSALTLPPLVGEFESGWTIEAHICEDWYEWINDFEAFHPFFGRVWGDFQDTIYTDSETGFQHFYENHPPQEWDYEDI